MSLLDGAVYVHYIPQILADLGVSDSLTRTIVGSHIADGTPFLWHSLVSASLLVTPLALSLGADALARKFDERERLIAAGQAGGQSAQGAAALAALFGSGSQGTGVVDSMTKVAYGYLPLVWFSNLAYWIGLGMAEGGLVLPRLGATFGASPELQSLLPHVSAGHEVVQFVQGCFLLAALPPAFFLTQKLSAENGFGPVRQFAQVVVQLLLVGELWHLMIR